MFPSPWSNDLAIECGAVRPLRAVDAAAGDQAGQVGDPDAEDLLGQDVVDAFLQVRDLVARVRR